MMKEKDANSQSWYYIRHNIIPLTLVIICTPGAVLLGSLTREGGPSNLKLSIFLGTSFSWTVVLSLVAWAIISLKVPCKKFLGPKTPFGYTPVYQANGFAYYALSLSVFLTLTWLLADLPAQIYEQMPAILGTLNILALTLCTWLYIKGKWFNSSSERLPSFPAIFEFFRGMEIHPKMLNMDVKQLTNCRIGVMAWQLLVITAFIVGCQRFGWNHGFAVNVILQTVYLAKFFHWETGYFNTLDITHDRAGYYICFGCLVFVPGTYTFTSMYFVENPPRVSALFSFVCLVGGIISLLLNYEVDRQKVVFRKTNGKCLIWGSKPEYLNVEYFDCDGKQRSKLLTSAFWGMARHTNYAFEILLTVFWNLPGLGLGLFPFLYCFYIIILLTHRTYRDEEKCAKKYGVYWEKYCQRVKYRLIPYVF